MATTDHSLISTDLHQEFSVINLNIPNLTMEEMNPIKRFCIISATNNFTSCKLEITFPALYPNDVSPNFRFLESKDSSSDLRKSLSQELSPDIKSKLLTALQNTAQVQVKRNRPCLEPCLREFVSTLDKLSSNSVTTPVTTPPNVLDYSALYGQFDDAHVPFPRTSGATFCSADILVCFGRPSHLQQINAATEFTPRALSALCALQANFRTQAPPTATTNGSAVGNMSSNITLRTVSVSELSNLSMTPQPHVPSISSFYFNSRKKTRHRPQKKTSGLPGTTKISMSSLQNSFSYSSASKCGPVYIFSVAGILPCSRILAETYIFSPDVPWMCQKNAAAAGAVNRKDLVQAWNLAELCAAPEVVSGSPQGSQMMEAPWSFHPAGRNLIQSLIDYYLNTCGDIQTAVMLCCAFTECSTCGKLNCFPRPCNRFQQQQLQQQKSSNSLNTPGSSPYHTVALSSPLQETSMDEWSLVTAVESLKRHRSNSWSDSVETALLSGALQSMSPYQTGSQAYRVHCNEMALLRDQRDAEIHELNARFLDSKLSAQYDWIKQIYTDLLMRWGLWDKRVEVLKYVSPSHNYQLEYTLKTQFLKTASICSKCGKEFEGVKCVCKQVFKCSVCRIIVKGVSAFCIKCGHGGHLYHIYDWFAGIDIETCPAGCGCYCLFAEPEVNPSNVKTK